MKERPILFNPEMIEAYQLGTKNQTRRAAKPQPKDTEIASFIHSGSPYGVVGDKLWFKETHYLYGYWVTDGTKQTKLGKQKLKFSYQQEKGVMFSDCPPKEVFTIKEGQSGRGWFKRPSLFMPRWAARFNPTITDIGFERVQDISEEDSKSEGIIIVNDNDGHGDIYKAPNYPNGCTYATARRAFSTLWDSINKDRGLGWDRNPWVWVVDFERVK